MHSPNAALNGVMQPTALQADMHRLTPILPELAALALLSCGGSARALDEAGIAAIELERLLASGLVVRHGSLLALSPDARARLSAAFGVEAFQALSAAFKALAALALGLDPVQRPVKRYLSRAENVVSAALSRLYDLTGLPAMPARGQVRFALAKALLEARFPDYAQPLSRASKTSYRTNSLTNALIIGLAGGTQKTIAEAENDMLFNALHQRRGTIAEVPAALARSALSLGAARPAEKPTARLPDLSDLVEFAAAVRALARTMETKPYKGRVAIAEVYDAGMARGLAFGALESFKSRLAEACRAGHIDLERYDIAGPMDATLRERSRTPFGRDERHFIVNQWI
jgi:hypothetical protein